MTDRVHEDDPPFVPLAGLRVGISGSIPERQYWGTAVDLDQLILRFVAQLSGVVLKYGGEVVHGSHPSFTPLLEAEARRFGSERPEKSLTLVASRLFGEPPPEVARASSVANIILTPRIGDGPPNDVATRNASLSALRLELARRVDVVVAVGGKLHRETGYNPGVLEELTFARWQDVPCFLVANFGGLTGEVDTAIVRELSKGNRLDQETLKSMSVWSGNVDECVGGLLEHFVAHAREFRALTIGRQAWHEHKLKVDNVFGETAEDPAKEVRRLEGRFAAVRAAFEKGDVDTLGALLDPAAPWFARASTPERKLIIPKLKENDKPKTAGRE